MRRTSHTTGWWGPGILLALTVSHAQGTMQCDDWRVAPGVVNPTETHTTSASPDGLGKYQFEYQGSHTVRYTLDLQNTPAGLIDVAVEFDGGPPFRPLVDAGVRYRVGQTLLEPHEYPPQSTTLDSHILVGDVLTVEYTDTVDTQPRRRRHRYSMEGQTLRIEIEAISPDSNGLDNYAGFSPGVSADTPDARPFTPPYSRYPVGTFAAAEPGDTVFYGTYVEPSVSSSLYLRPYVRPAGDGVLGVGSYTLNQPNSADEVAPFHEVAYLAVSDSLVDILPRSLTTPSSQRDDLTPRVVFQTDRLPSQFQRFAGTELAWVASATETVQIGVGFGLTPIVSKGPTRFEVRHGETLVFEQSIMEDDPNWYQWSTTLLVGAGEEVRFRVDPGGSSLPGQDILSVVAIVTDGQGTHNAATEFTTVNEPPNWRYRRFHGATTAPLAWDADANAWSGPGGWALQLVAPGVPDVLLLNPTPFVFRNAEAFLDTAESYGMKDLLILYHDWMKHGFDTGIPDVYHPRTEYGGRLDFADFLQRGVDLGFRMAPYENYRDIYPDDRPELDNQHWADGVTCPGIDPFCDRLAHDAQGALKLGWTNAEGQQGYLIAIEDSVHFADLEGAEITATLPNNATYLDVVTLTLPELQADLRALDSSGLPQLAPTMAATFPKRLELFDAQRNRYGGPLLGEGGDQVDVLFDTYYAGCVDGVERQIFGHSDSLTLPDFELTAVRPLMANHGMGLAQRYFGRHDTHVDPVEPTPEELDRYVAQEIAYAHAAFIDPAVFDPWTHAERLAYTFHHYYAVRAIQELLLDTAAEPQSITYQLPGQSSGHTLSELVRDELPLDDLQLEVVYDSGLEVAVNMATGFERAVGITGFSPVQGLGGWSYRAIEATAETDLEWQPSLERYTHAGSEAWLGPADGEPTLSVDVARVYVLPKSGTVDIRVDAHDKQDDPNVPLDETLPAVRVRVLHNGQEIGVLDVADGSVKETQRTLQILGLAVTVGDELKFVTDADNADEQDRTYAMPVVSYAGASPKWTTAVAGKTYELPTYGWAARSSDGTVEAWSALVDNEHLDYAVSPDYEYLRSRSGLERTVGTLTTDGAAAVDPTEFDPTRHHGHLVQGTVLRHQGATVAQLGPRADLQILHDSPTVVRLLPDFPVGASTVDVDYTPPYPVGSTVTVEAIDPEGPVSVSSAVWSGNAIDLDGLVPGWTYRLTHTPPTQSHP